MDPQRVLAALADETRYQLFNRLINRGPASASSLAHESPISRQAIAKHLQVLEEVGLVERSRAGREVRFLVDTAPLDELSEWAREAGSRWDERLQRLRGQTSSH